jgi:hypothetical protein
MKFLSLGTMLEGTDRMAERPSLTHTSPIFCVPGIATSAFQPSGRVAPPGAEWSTCPVSGFPSAHGLWAKRCNGPTPQARRGRVTVKRKSPEFPHDSSDRRKGLRPCRYSLERARKKADRPRSQHSVLQATENGENCVASMSVVQERDRGCIVECADWSTKPAHGVRPIPDHFHRPANDGGLSLIFAFELRGVRLRAGAGQRRSGLSAQVGALQHYFIIG